MSDDNLYDEFGNYIGPDLEEDNDSEVEKEEEDEWLDGDGVDVGRDGVMDDDELTTLEAGASLEHAVVDYDADKSRAVVLHEDKQYYPDAQDLYGGAEVMVEDEDTQPLDKPIIDPLKTKLFSLVEKSLPATTFDFKYLAGLMDHPHFVRNLAFVGHLHHGKTSMVDLFVQETHTRDWDIHKESKYADSRIDEQERGLSLKAKPISLVLPNLIDKSYQLNIFDTPGHVNFSEEATAAFRLVDGVVIVVDAIEGVMLNTERMIRHAIEERLPIVLCINKVDRLILEEKLPPADAYFKLCHTIEEVNAIAEKCGYTQRISPELGNVVFASAFHGWCFTVPSFAKYYADHHKNFSHEKFAKRLWGNIFLHTDRTFKSKPEQGGAGKRTFVEFILEPIYKIYSHVLGSEPEELKTFCQNLGVGISSDELALDTKPLLKIVLSRFFGTSSGFVDMVVTHFPSPLEAARGKIPFIYTGDLTTAVARGMMACDPKAPLMINITKSYGRPDCSAFDSYGRVLSGTVKVGDKVRVMREGYSLDDEEESSVLEVTRIWIFQAGRYRVEVNRVIAGNCALFEGLDNGITKTATVASLDAEGACLFRPLNFNSAPVMKVAIEPVVPSELPKMLDGLRKINKDYPNSRTKVEESGEHIILGTGELYMDCILHDLRKMYSEIEIKVSDPPVVRFCETVVETSSLKCFAETPNKKNKLTMIAEPMEQGIAEDIENGVLMRMSEEKGASTTTLDTAVVSKFFQEKYEWDLLAARSVWSFGPDLRGPNVLCDDTLISGSEKKKLFSIKDSIVQGFQWSTREGPLCDEPMRNVKMKIMDVSISDEMIERARGQIIPTARRVAYSSFLLASPRLMEPIYFVEIQAPADCVTAVSNVLARRRGHAIASLPKPGTPLYIVQAYIPLIDSFGFETDLRLHTHGLAFCTSVFDHWQMVPGDPLDKSIVLRPLEVSPVDHLAREFMVKTRRRKGLSEDVSINKFFDELMLLELAKQDAELQSYFQ